MPEMDRPASDRHFTAGTICEVNDFGRHLRRKAEEIGGPGPIRDNFPALASGDRARSLINIRAQLSAKRFIDPGRVVETTPDAPDLSVLGQARQRHVDRRPAGDVEKILRGEGLSLAEALDARNYLISHGLHGLCRRLIKNKCTTFS
jgi:hypothetical protein